MQTAWHRSLVLSAACASITASPANAQTIDFETLPNGTPTVDLEFIDDQFLATLGVRFDLVDPVTLAPTAAPRIAKVGAPETAFVGCGPDTPLPNQNVGLSFLTNDTSISSTAGTLLLSYTSPVAQASGVILDIDRRSNGTYEEWTIEALDASQTLIDTFVITAPTGPDTCNNAQGPGDARAAGFAFNHPTSDIHFIVLRYTGNASSIGLAFDNFSPSTAPGPVQASIHAPAEVCTADPVTLTANTTDGVPLFQYQWQTDPGGGFADIPGETSQTLELVAHAAATYRVVITDALNNSDTSAPVTIDPDPLLGYRVESEVSPGAGTYTTLTDTLQPISHTGTLASYYGWTSGSPVFNGPAPALTVDRAHLFLVQADDGIGLFHVFDALATNAGGRTETVIEFSSDTPELLVRDDTTSDVYTGSGTNQIEARNTWTSPNTDGYVIAPLSSASTATLAFQDAFSGTPTISGLDSWAAYDADGTEHTLPLTENHRVRLTANCGCPADTNNDGILDNGDIGAFIALFLAADPAADFNNDTFLDNGDIAAFIAAFLAGCSP